MASTLDLLFTVDQYLWIYGRDLAACYNIKLLSLTWCLDL